MLIEGGDEDQQRGAGRLELRRHFQAAQPGHLDIQEHHVRLLPGDRRRGREPVGGLADERDVRLRGEPAAQLVAGRCFVVDDEYPDHSWV